MPSFLINGIDLETLNQTVTAIARDPALGKCTFRAINTWDNATRNSSAISVFYVGGQEQKHQVPFLLQADEPALLGGADRFPNPAEHLLNALAGCLTTSLVAHAAVLGIEIDALESEIEGDIDLNGFLGMAPNVARGFTDIRVRLRMKADPDNISRLRDMADYSPVYNTLVKGARVHIDLDVE